MLKEEYNYMGTILICFIPNQNADFKTAEKVFHAAQEDYVM